MIKKNNNKLTKEMYIDYIIERKERQKTDIKSMTKEKNIF